MIGWLGSRHSYLLLSFLYLTVRNWSALDFHSSRKNEDYPLELTSQFEYEEFPSPSYNFGLGLVNLIDSTTPLFFKAFAVHEHACRATFLFGRKFAADIETPLLAFGSNMAKESSCLPAATRAERTGRERVWGCYPCFFLRFRAPVREIQTLRARNYKKMTKWPLNGPPPRALEKTQKY